MSESIKLGLFTYDIKNGLGLIGYNVDEHEHQTGYYDVDDGDVW